MTSPDRQETQPIKIESETAPQPELSSVGENEKTPEKEKYELVLAIALCGPSNTGKDVLAAILQERYGWEVEDGSSYGFQRRGTSPHQGYIERKSSDHRKFDTEQAMYFRELGINPNLKPKIMQTRLSHIILAEERDRRAQEIIANQRKRQNSSDVEKLEPIPAISVELKALKPTRVARAYKTAHDHWEDQQARLSRGESLDEGEELITAEPTSLSVERAMDRKERKTIDEDWAPIHQKYIKAGSNPFKSTLTRPNGGPVIDFYIDTDKKVGGKIVSKTIEEVVDEFIELALSHGAIRKIEPETPTDPTPREETLINGGTIFNSEDVRTIGEPFSLRPA